MEYQNKVQGISDIPFNGNSIISQELLYIYVFLFILLVAGAIFYSSLHKRKKFKKAKFYILIAIALDGTFLIFSAFLAGYWLIPSPVIDSISPGKTTNNVSIRNPNIEIVFDRPVERTRLEKYITPDTAGTWVYDNTPPGTNLYKKLIFYPSTTLKTDTEYTVTLLNISGYVNKKPTAYTYSFTTQSSPRVVSTYPQSGSEKINPDAKIEITLDTANDDISDMDFELSPSHPIDINYDKDNLKYILSPRTPFVQGEKYVLSVRKTNLSYMLPENTLVRRGDTTTEYNGTFAIAEAPGIESFEPKSNNVLITTPVTITFSDSMNRESVENNFEITPKLFGAFTWEGNTMTFKPFDMRHETEYTVRIPQGTRSDAGGYLARDIVRSFTTIGSVAITSVFPEDKWRAISVDAAIQVTFDQDVDRASAEDKFAIEPDIDGSFLWNANTLIFEPASTLTHSTTYKIIIAAGVLSKNGLPSKSDFVSEFTTEAQTVKLDVPTYLQKYSLSCEIAALRMALEFKGIRISEDTIIADIGFDNTPNSGGIWGDPHSAFVGNINGKQMVNGYGVYWEPIAKAARKYREAKEFTNGNLSEVLKEVEQGNPVVVWTYTKNGSKVTWNTPAGKLIQGIYGEHAVVVVGFVGPYNNPTHIIVNDPLVGQVYWDRVYFEERWNSLSRSGVIVY